MKTAFIEAAFFDALERAGLPLPVKEYRFHDTRKWRFDYAWPDYKVAIEMQGGIWSKKSAHTSPLGRLRDMEKGNAAIMCGWAVLECTTESSVTAKSKAWKGEDMHLYGDYMIDCLKQLLNERELD